MADLTPSNPQPPPISLTQLRVLAQRRQYGAGSVIYTPALIYVEDAAGSPPAPYTIVMTGPDGLISPTLLPPYTPGSTILLETNGTPNTLQDTLNLIQGPNIALVADAFGGVTISASGTISTSFTHIATGDNTTAAMTVDTGATLSYANNGVVNANEIGSINIAGNAPTHPGEVLISQPGNTTAVWADPQVQGLYAVGSFIDLPPAYAAPTTIQPVLVGGSDYNGGTPALWNLKTDSGGRIYVGNFPPFSFTDYGSPAVSAANVYVVNPVSLPPSLAVTQSTSPWVVQDSAAEGSLAVIEAVAEQLTFTKEGSPSIESLNVFVTNQTETAIAPISSTGEAPANATVGPSSVQILAFNTLRKGCNITNTSSSTISLAFGSNAAVLYSGTMLYPGATFWMDLQDFTTAAINAIASDSSGSVSIQEYE
jgi:hypothetical protein